MFNMYKYVVAIPHIYILQNIACKSQTSISDQYVLVVPIIVGENIRYMTYLICIVLINNNGIRN